MTVWVSGSRVKPTSTSGWGWYDPYDTGELEMHYGDDEIGFDWNCAPEAGVIVYAAWNGAAGIDIRLRSDRDGTIFRWLHNADFGRAVVGEHYDEGEPVSPQGGTGGVARHTHFEVWPGGNINNRCDPVPWMQARVGSSTAGDGGNPVVVPPIVKKILKAGRSMKCMVLGNLDNGQVAFIIVGGEHYIFGSVTEYNDFLTVLSTYNSMPDTPAEWKWPLLPPIGDNKRLLFVSNARFDVTLKALTTNR